MPSSAACSPASATRASPAATRCRSRTPGRRASSSSSKRRTSADRTHMVPSSDESWDFLVIGSGIAGLTFALSVADHGRVAIVTKDRSRESNSSYAQGGIASVWSPEDSFAAHAEDTLVAGAGLCHEDVVQMVVREGPDRIRELIALGTRFDTHGDGDAVEYDL